jgi:hypothetical protein
VRVQGCQGQRCRVIQRVIDQQLGADNIIDALDSVAEDAADLLEKQPELGHHRRGTEPLREPMTSVRPGVLVDSGIPHGCGH